MSGPSATRFRFLRWSWRDLRRNWVSVVTIALVLAIGTGVFAGLGSTATWRRQTNDASFAALRLHDLRIALSPGTFTDQGALLAVVAAIEEPAVTSTAERLVVDSQVDASADGESVLVRARVVGTDLTPDAPVDSVWVRDGAAEQVAILEAKFVDYHGLAVAGTVEIAGGQVVAYTGLGMGPEEFYISGPDGSVFAESDLAHLYLPLGQAQDLVGHAGEVNDLVLTLGGAADIDDVVERLEAELDRAGLGATVTDRDDVEAFRVLYEDIENDQQIWNALSALVLFAAALAAFNLVSRVVESQRREIGIGMALGVSRARLAIRPMLVGVQVALLGVVAGVIAGLAVGAAMGNLLESFLPMPEYRTPFQSGVFARAAAIGLVVPIVASAVPVWRAVRVEPIDAIRTGHLAARSGRLGSWAGRMRLPGSSLVQMPLRNLLRTPRRTVLTVLGVGAAITAMVAVMGMLDSFSRAIDRGGDELTRGDPDRVIVQLDTFHPTDSELVGAIAVTDAVESTDAGLRFPVQALTGSEDDIDLILELIDFDSAAWTPTLDDVGDLSSGVILADKAAGDLGVGVGDMVTLRHPQRLDGGAFTITDGSFVVAGIHPNPIRTFAYADMRMAERFGMAGLTNVVQAYPADGSGRVEVQRAVFTLSGVTSTQAVARLGEVFDEALEQFVGFLIITAGAVLLLALLIAFNTSRITVDERRREHATMQAFGLPPRSVMGVVIREGLVVGVLATAVGLLAGTAMLNWMLRSLASRTLPDFGIERYVSPTTVALAALVGVVAVAVAPVFLYRRIRRMSLPDTLRVME
ncbi:MAG: FtsX-like permease family protein [Acidimicrobiales bacterium]